MIREVSIFSEWPHLKGWFTEKESERVNPRGALPGFNFGYHTQAPDEEVTTNRERLCRELGVNRDQLVTARQMHSTRVRVVESGGFAGECDALVTDRPGLVLGIQVADCAAVLMADPDRGVVAAAHAGWRGTADGIVTNTVQTMVRRFGVRPESLHVYVSPSLSVTHFEVGEEVAGRFDERFLDRSLSDRPHLDLKKAVAEELVAQAVPRSQIEVDSGCTWSDSERYFSWRRERHYAGRMLGLIQRRVPDIGAAPAIRTGSGGSVNGR